MLFVSLFLNRELSLIFLRSIYITSNTKYSQIIKIFSFILSAYH